MAQQRKHELPAVESLREKLRLCEDTGLLFWRDDYNWPSRGRKAKRFDRPVGAPTKQGYLYINFNGATTTAHRVAWALHYGNWPDKHVDHINRCKTDNRISNLRLVDRTQNLTNSRLYKNNKSGHRGVFWYPRTNRWKARIRVNNKIIELGYHKDKDDAIKAVQAALPVYPGEYAGEQRKH